MNTAITGTQEMAAGAMGLAGTGFLIYESLQPAIEMENALGEVKAIGLARSSTPGCEQWTAIDLSASYGMVASEIVTGSALLKRSIDNLSSIEYTAMTKAACER